MDVSINRVLKLGQQKLKKNGNDDYVTEANILFGYSANKTLENIFSRLEDRVPRRTRERFLQLVERRVCGEPISYICERSCFYSNEYIIKKGVFVPRPETEILAEVVISEVKKNHSNNLICLDMCTGSGCVGLTIAKEAAGTKKIFLVDKSIKALRCCRENQEAMGLGKKTKLIHSNLFQSVPRTKFDYIFANPPYIDRSEEESLDVSIRDYEPKGALFSGARGLFHIKQISSDSRSFLKKNGKIFLEVGHTQAEETKSLLEVLGYKSVESFRDLNKIDRVVAGTWKK
jgi:release factor glutamine methyltransferase